MRRKQRNFGPKKIGKGEANFLAELYKNPSPPVPDETKGNFFDELHKQWEDDSNFANEIPHFRPLRVVK